MVSEQLRAILNCLKAAREEVEASFERTFGMAVKISVIGEIDDLVKRLDEIRPLASGRCLILEWRFREEAIVVLLPDRGAIPTWADSPDATGQAKLATLAQELGILLFPPDWPLIESAARMVADGSQEIDRGEPEAFWLNIPVTLEGQQSALLLAAQIPQGKSGGDFTGQATSVHRTADALSETMATRSSSRSCRGSGFVPRVSSRLVPLLTRSLLKIKLSVEVILARARKPLAEILQLGPGTIIQFEKLCDEPLELAVNGYVIARGEAVKVGDKFGLRILEMALPPERYVVLSGKSVARANPRETASSDN